MRIQWSDNTCSVGWTSLHGYFTPGELQRLLDVVPNATITPTFYEAALHPSRGLSAQEVITRYEKMWVRRKCARGFYFTFPEDTRGIELLTALRLLCDIQRWDGRYHHVEW